MVGVVYRDLLTDTLRQRHNKNTVRKRIPADVDHIHVFFC